MSTVPFNSGRRYPLPPDIAKKLPHNLDAERALLGAVLLDNKILKQISDELSLEDFFLQQNRLICKFMIALVNAGSSIDLVTLIDELMRQSSLEAAGGAGYVASLTDGVPKISNIKDYIEILKRDSVRRQLIYECNRLEQMAFEENATPDDLLNEWDLFAKRPRGGKNPAVHLNARALMTLDLPPAEFVIEPLLTVGGTGMVYAKPGAGKSFIMMELAVRLALGEADFFGWPITRGFKVLYVFGEMHGAMIKERAIQIAKGHNLYSNDERLELIQGRLGMLCKDFQRLKGSTPEQMAWRPKISSARDRKIIEDTVFAGGYELLILDNISTLWPASEEGESDMAAVLEDWFIDLNQRGITIIFVHHAGKGGDQLGSSRKEHILDFNLKMERPRDYEREEGLRVKLMVDKIRAQCRNAKWMTPFEVVLRTDENGTEWQTRPLKHEQMKLAFEMFNNGMRYGEVAQNLEMDRTKAYRWHLKWKQQSDINQWIADEAN